MNEYNVTDRHRELEQLSTQQLDDLLQTETAKAVPDDDMVLLILNILEEREKDFPLELTEQEKDAWEKYQTRIAGRVKRPVPLRRWFAVAASLVVVVGILFAVVPQNAEAETFWEMLQRWTESVLEYFNPREDISSLDYEFETKNPGLLQVYDAVMGLGVTEPVVPMWLPEGSELIELGSQNTPMQKSIWAGFLYNESDIVYKIDVYKGEPAHQFYRDDIHYDEYERNGITHHITQNNGWWVVVWSKDNIECFLTLDCQEDTLQRILESIYVMEDD